MREKVRRPLRWPPRRGAKSARHRYFVEVIGGILTGTPATFRCRLLPSTLTQARDSSDGHLGAKRYCFQFRRLDMRASVSARPPSPMISVQPYLDRREAGQILAAHLRARFDTTNALVLALPRG